MVKKTAAAIAFLTAFGTPLAQGGPAWWQQHATNPPKQFWPRNLERCRYFIAAQMPLEGQTRRLYIRQECPTSGNHHTFIDINCTQLDYRVIGDSIEGPEKIKPLPNAPWQEPIIGSSKHAAVKTTCFPP